MSKIPNLFELMKENKVTQQQLSEAVGVSQGNISDWKSGRSTPNIEAIIKIAKFFSVSTDYILGLDYIPNRKEYITEAKGIDKQAFNMFSKLSDTNKGIIIGRMEVMLAEETQSKNAEVV